MDRIKRITQSSCQRRHTAAALTHTICVSLLMYLLYRRMHLRFLWLLAKIESLLDSQGKLILSPFGQKNPNNIVSQTWRSNSRPFRRMTQYAQLFCTGSRVSGPYICHFSRLFLEDQTIILTVLDFRWFPNVIG